MKKSSIYDMLYMNNLNPIYDEINKEVWGSQERKINSFLVSKQIDEFIEQLDINKNTTFLDICCGDGRPLMYITGKAKCKSYGIDFNELSIDTAKKAVQKTDMDCQFFNADIIKEKLPFNNEYINALLCIESICHFSTINRVNIFKEWNRVLKPDAKLIVTDPFIITGGINHKQIMQRCIFGDYFLLPAGLQEELLTQSGFKILKVENITEKNGYIIPQEWRLIRERKRKELMKIESETDFCKFNDFLKLSEELFKNKVLSQYTYYCIKSGTI